MFSLAKIKRRTKNHGLYKFGSELNLFNFNILNYHLIPYNPDTLIETGELYKIEKFSEKVFFQKWLSPEIDSKDYNQIETNQYEQITFIVEVLDNKDFCIQLTGNSNYIRKKKFIEFGEELKIEKEKTIILIKDIPDAYYQSATDTLAFSSLAVLDKIFDGASALYKTATDNQVLIFIKAPHILLENGFGPSNVSVLNRKKIALCADIFRNISAQDQQKIFQEIKNDAPDIVCKKTGKFLIKNDIDLKFFLYGVQQRYYTTKVGNEKRIANSVINL